MIARSFALVAGLILLASIIWAGFVMGASLFGDGARILELPWGVVTLIDLYAGFILAAVVIFVVEPNKAVAAAWALPIFFLGNIVTAAWVVWRASRLALRPKA